MICLELTMAPTMGACSSTTAPSAQMQLLLAPYLRGRDGEPGPAVDPNGDELLLARNRLAEFATDPTAQAAAQTNLGLGTADPLAYYILAKA